MNVTPESPFSVPTLQTLQAPYLRLPEVNVDRAARLCYDDGRRKGESPVKIGGLIWLEEIVEKLEAKHRVIPEEAEQVFHSYAR